MCPESRPSRTAALACWAMILSLMPLAARVSAAGPPHSEEAARAIAPPVVLAPETAARGIPARAPAPPVPSDTLWFGYYTVIGGQQFAVLNEKWTFDHGAIDPKEGWTATDLSGLGSFFSITPVSQYVILDPGPCGLAGNVAALHDATFQHPDGQHVMITSPPVKRSLYPSYRGVLARWDMYAELPYDNGVFYRVGWDCGYQAGQNINWTGRVGSPDFRYLNGFDCFNTLEATDQDVPQNADYYRLIFELFASCQAFGIPPGDCTGVTNFTPIFDNIQIGLTAGGPSVEGTVYRDLNGNCIRDQNEGGLQGFEILVDGQSQTYTDSNGSYSVWLTAGSHTVTMNPLRNWQQTCPAGGGGQVVNVVNGQTLAGIDFAASPIAGRQDLSVLMGALRAKPGDNTGYYITYKNVGSVPMTNTVVTLTLPSLVTYTSSSGGGIYNPGNGTVQWNRAAVPVGYSELLWVVGTVSTNAPIGSNLNSSVAITPAVDYYPADNSASAVQTVVSAFDPNEKLVTPEGQILLSDQLRYHINFQNVGTAEATNVVVRDTLDANLDENSVTAGATSHACTASRHGRVLVFTFANINLPDSTSDEPHSHGFVEFWARPDPNLPGGAQISNRADIYFDYNPAVRTNVVTNYISTTGVREPVPGPAGEASLLSIESIRPQPSSGEVSLRLRARTSGPLSSSIHDASGRLVRRLPARQVTSGDLTLTWDGRDGAGRPVPTGVYYFRGRIEQGKRGENTQGRLVVVR